MNFIRRVYRELSGAEKAELIRSFDDAALVSLCEEKITDELLLKIILAAGKETPRSSSVAQNKDPMPVSGRVVEAPEKATPTGPKNRSTSTPQARHASPPPSAPLSFRQKLAKKSSVPPKTASRSGSEVSHRPSCVKLIPHKLAGRTSDAIPDYATVSYSDLYDLAFEMIKKSGTGGISRANLVSALFDLGALKRRDASAVYQIGERVHVLMERGHVTSRGRARALVYVAKDHIVPEPPPPKDVSNDEEFRFVGSLKFPMRPVSIRELIEMNSDEMPEHKVRKEHASLLNRLLIKQVPTYTPDGAFEGKWSPTNTKD